MLNSEFIALLQKLPADHKVQVKTYGCGYDHWNDVTSDMVVLSQNDKQETIIEIVADFN